MRQRIPCSIYLACIPVLPLMLALLIYQAGWQASSFLYLNHLTQALPNRFWAALTFLGNGWGAFAIAFPLLILAPRLLTAGLFAGAISGIATAILKPLFSLPRPANLLADGSFNRVGELLLNNSMPSGHTLTAFAIASALYLSYSPKHKKALLILFILATFVGVSRIAVGAHWITDVLTGMGAGLWCGMLGAKLASRIPDAHLLPNKIWPRTIALSGVLAAYALLTQTMDIDLNQVLQYVGVFIILITLGLFLKSQSNRAI